jgi:hypothetical protein
VLYGVNERLYLWRADQIVDLYALAGVEPTVWHPMRHAYLSKSVVAFTHRLAGTMAYTADGVIHRLNAGRYGLVWGVNDQGDVIGFFADFADAYYKDDGQAFVWRNGRMRFLDLPGVRSYAWNINNAGDIVGHDHLDLWPGNSDRTYLVRRGRVREIGLGTSLTDAPWILETALSEDGQVAFNGFDWSTGKNLWLYREPVTAVPDLYSAVQGAALSIDADAGVLANDLGASVTARLKAKPKNGSLSLQSDGAFTYTPSAGFLGVDSFTYAATSDEGLSKPVTVRIQVVGVNSPPAASAPDTTVMANPWDGTTVTVRASATDANDPVETLTYEWTKDGQTLCVGPKLVTSLEPGVHVFTVTVRDPHGASPTATATITVIPWETPF